MLFFSNAHTSFISCFSIFIPNFFHKDFLKDGYTKKWHITCRVNQETRLLPGTPSPKRDWGWVWLSTTNSLRKFLTGRKARTSPWTIWSSRQCFTRPSSPVVWRSSSSLTTLKGPSHGSSTLSSWSHSTSTKSSKSLSGTLALFSKILHIVYRCRLEYRNSLEYRKIGLWRFFPVFGSVSVLVTLNGPKFWVLTLRDHTLRYHNACTLIKLRGLQSKSGFFS